MKLSFVLRGATVAASMACAVGCGHIEYGDSTQEVVEVRTGGGAYLVQDPPQMEYRAQVVQMPPAQPPPMQQPPRYTGPRWGGPPMARGRGHHWGHRGGRHRGGPGTVHCGGNERIRIHDEVVDGRGGPAVVATGGCVVEVTESILRGSPAIVVSGNARVELSESRIQGQRARRRGGPGSPAVVVHGNAQVEIVECRVQGDLVSSGAGHIGTRGVAHRGQVLHGAF